MVKTNYSYCKSCEFCLVLLIESNTQKHDYNILFKLYHIKFCGVEYSPNASSINEKLHSGYAAGQ